MRRKSFVSKVNRKKRIDFAIENEKQDRNFWNSVIFSDENKFNSHGSDGHQKVWKKANAALEPKNMRGTVKHGGGWQQFRVAWQQLQQQVWEEHLTSLDAEDGSLWGTARAFRKKASPISALNGPNGIALSDSNKTDLIAQSLESQFQLNNIHNPQKDQIITNIVDAYITDHTNNTDPIPPALPSEVISYIKKIKVKKSLGRDGITNKMIKKLPLLTVFKITNIINNMFKLRYFPNAWKTAVVIPLLKPGKNPKLAESHRPISLLPILSKLAEKIISTRLNDYLENENILVPEQHRFRPRLSTTHQLLRVVEYIKDGIDGNQYTAAVFLDIQKAFDRVWHTGLLFKLITYKIPPPLILLLKSYISDRSFTVKINRTFSQVRSAKASIAQGSILGPVLFNLYINDIIKSTNTMICMYADDTAILSRHYNPNTQTQNINEHLAHFEIWFSVWKIALNTTKTEAVSFSQKRPPKSRFKAKKIPGLSTPNTLSKFPPPDVAAVAEWYRHRIVAGFVTSSSPVPLKTRRVGQRCTLNLSRVETSSRWCGVVVRRGGASSSVVHVT
ncbi:probable RNA-directed DNA polymerase from transposon X-element [Trichonephila clavipes]|uniref:Probable RNA-directed DNA polymerase from transposon X-element n=1 Tax=Trichonephila clavipes TaxID=2585209 RepID=A0A8X6STY7_TRICX|nr:probable RNA-directed DNA polymerase from transposon X-element [Trichonephila clavipes]